jgi:hypothetical protein
MNIPNSKMYNYEESRLRAWKHIAPLFSNSEEARSLIFSLPIKHSIELPKGWNLIQMPEWAEWVVPNNSDGLFLPSFSTQTIFENYPWWRAINFYFSLEFETNYENLYGPIQSNSKLLGVKSTRAFDHAWVNRIAAFLKSWSALRAGKSIEQLFGEIPIAKIILTHDLDAIEMTPVLKLKQAVSRIISKQYLTASRILFSKRKDNFLEVLLQVEKEFGFKSKWFFYAKPKKSHKFSRHFLDPEYSLDNSCVVSLINGLNDLGNKIGLHSSFNSWGNRDMLSSERQDLAAVCGTELCDVRQHWLRFSLKKTWVAQQSAGFRTDFTLGFNDRLGFRASTALPIDLGEGEFQAISTVIMDSNLFCKDYRSDNQRQLAIDKILNELEEFGGLVAINWHPHTLGEPYGWLDTYSYLLSSLKTRRIEVVI